MKKLKISLIAIALIIGGVQAYGGMKAYTYYCVAGTLYNDSYYTVALSSPALMCAGGTTYNYVCTFSAPGLYNQGQQIASGACTILTSYEN